MTGTRERKPVIVVDGPAGAGKSTVCRRFAEAAGYCCLDTGALYRTVAWRARARNIPLDDETGLVHLCRDIKVLKDEGAGTVRIHADGEEIGDQIRTGDMGMAASLVSRHPAVREALLPLQRETGSSGGIIAEGRDMGTVVFPDAPVKIFLDAEPSERADRRYRELRSRGESPDYQDILEEINRRDEQDRNRAAAPLKPSDGAVIVDTTRLSVEEVVRELLNIVRAWSEGRQDSAC